VFAPWLIVGFAATLSGLLTPEVRGDSNCPTPAEVAAKLPALLPSSRPMEISGTPDVVVIEGTGKSTIVRLLERGKRTVEERTLEDASSCAERATAAAVLVAIWEAHLHSDVSFPPIPLGSASNASVLSLAPPPLAAAAPEAPNAAPPKATASNASAPNALPAEKKPAESSPNSAPPALPTATPPTLAPQPARPSAQLTLGAELLYSTPFSGGGEPGGALELTLGPAGEWAGRLSVETTRAHQLALGAGKINWQRWTVCLGGEVDLIGQNNRISVHVEGLITAVVAGGEGFAQNRDATIWQGGLSAGLRGSMPAGKRLRLWIDATLAAWPGRQRLGLSDLPDTTVDLPSWEALLGVGASLGVAR